ncbi:hypothetical protein GCM10010335_60660 [Streptomyces galbus]|nr:hypothetical protein GCM10010335_60660 [Streptomyces galbus]
MPASPCPSCLGANSTCTRACPMAVTPMDEDAVKWLPVARPYRYPADTHAYRPGYDTCPIAIGS